MAGKIEMMKKALAARKGVTKLTDYTRKRMKEEIAMAGEGEGAIRKRAEKESWKELESGR